MARIVTGTVIADIRGTMAHGNATRAGSTIYARNRSGLYVRDWALPANPRTAQQQNWRTNWANAGYLWYQVLTDNQRTAWTREGATTRRNNTLGTPHTLTGLQLFTQVNQLLQATGHTYITDLPPHEPAQDPGELSASSDSITPELTLTTQNPLPADHGCIIRATAALSPARYFVSPFLRQLWLPPAPEFQDTMTPGAITPPFTSTPTYNASNWTAILTNLTYTKTTGQQDLRAGLLSDFMTAGATIALPDTTNTHSLLGIRVNPSTGEAYLAVFLPGPPKSAAIAYRATWTAAPTAIATAPWTTADTSPQNWQLAAQANQITLFLPDNTTLTATDSRLRTGDFTVAPSNGTVTYSNATAFSNLEPLPTPGDITAQYEQKFATFEANTNIGLELRYVNWNSGQASKTRTIIVRTT